MIVRQRLYGLGQGCEPIAAIYHHALQRIQIGERLVCHHLMQQRPQPLGWLQLGRVRRQVEQVQPVGNLQLVTPVPTRSIDHQYNLLVASYTLRRRKLLQRQAHQIRTHARQDQPPIPPTRWVDKAIGVQPGVALAVDRTWSALTAYPQATDDWFETDATFVLAPGFDQRLRMLGL